MAKLFLDDLRSPEMIYAEPGASEYDIVRSYAEFIEYIRENGLPDFISFDNDLGLDERGEVAPDGYAAAKWLVYESGFNLKNLEFKVHSANPVAAEQIRGLLNNYIIFIKNS
ncbi:cyclic-phosphate processing receiver domain-containing protein [Salinimicrobium sp. HB62]|uniref:cyclic-phosphate processing receiver domain-containing protein n=1 Tax=Salinimicrobium sp. HB62 TaxID=3077781 RepID=UPI002D76B27C|nr:cyclic-phosphate processing receiver domain-containing protein [Salinimicrobium sp. HB62]